MFRVRKTMEFCYGHRLLDYEGKCAHPHGHNARVEIEFSQQNLDKRGMVIDFVDIKKHIKCFLEDELDHRMLLRKDDPLVKVLRDMNEPVFVMQQNPTAENIAHVIFNYAISKGLPVTAVRLWETSSSFAEVIAHEE